jgi:ubiquinone biosynthesis protein UbiJ
MTIGALLVSNFFSLSDYIAEERRNLLTSSKLQAQFLNVPAVRDELEIIRQRIGGKTGKLGPVSKSKIGRLQG